MSEDTQVGKAEITREIEGFLDRLYPADIEGYVYSPTLKREDGKKGDWETHYFKWPAERSNIINHVLANTGSKDVYVGPALYKEPTTPIKSNVLGSQVVWVEFDGKEPQYTANLDLPKPDFWLYSSTQDHIHTYWTLDKFCTNTDELESANRALTYNLGADHTGWDCTQILRFPRSVNHKRKQFTSALMVNTQYEPAPVELFGALPAPKYKVDYESFDFSLVPGDINEMAWSKLLGPLGQKLFAKARVEQGGRSSALMALAYYMAEHTEPIFSDHEMFAVLYQADERWGKFKERKDRNKRLLDIVGKAREKYPLQSGGVDVTSHFEFMAPGNLVLDPPIIDWVIDGFLQENGLLFLVGPANVGKTRFTIQFGLHMACGKPFLGYTFPKPRKVLFFSMEMSHAELVWFYLPMLQGFTPQELELINQNFMTETKFAGESIYLDKEYEQRRIMQAIDSQNPDGVLFDSFSVSVSGELTNEGALKDVFQFLEGIRHRKECFLWFVHHNRKGTVGNKNPNELSDMYGSVFIGTRATSVVGMLPNKTNDFIDIKSLKMRMGPRFHTYSVVSDEDTLGYSLVTAQGLLDAAAQKGGENDDDTNQRFVSDF